MRKLILFLMLVAAVVMASAQTDKVYYFTQGDRQGSATPYGDNEAAGQYQQCGDVKLWHEVYGEGRPLFVFHGGGVGSPYEIGQLIDSLRAQRQFKVYVVSTRGHGRSEIGDKHMSLEQRAEDFAQLIKALEPGRKVSLVGFSDGAYSSMSVAVHYPELVERVVAIGAGTLKAGYMSADADVSAFEKADKRFNDQEMRLMPEPQRWQEFFADYMGYWHRLSLGSEFFGKIECPILFMVGDEDDHAPVQTVVDAYFMAPQSQLSVIPKAWHTCFLDNFEATWSAMKQFVTQDINNLEGSTKVSDIRPTKVESEQLLETSQSWDGATLPDYPEGKPQLKTVKYTFPAHSILGQHHHLIMSYGVVERGSLTLVRKDGTERTFNKGEAFVETVGTSHHGENRGDEPVEVTVFYITKPGIPLSVSDE